MRVFVLLISNLSSGASHQKFVIGVAPVSAFRLSADVRSRLNEHDTEPAVAVCRDYSNFCPRLSNRGVRAKVAVFVLNGVYAC